MSELEEAAVLLVATHRPDWTPPWAAEGPECFTQLALPRLNDDESLTLVAEVVTRTQLPDSLVQAIVARADGNPFFLEELARSVADDGAPEPALSVPDSLRAVLSARIDRLPDGPRRLLQTAAVLGREFPRDLLEAVWNGPGSVAAHVAELIRLDFVHNFGSVGIGPNAYEAAATVGTLGTPGRWRAFFVYQYVGRDAVVGAYNTDDWWFHTWYRGHRVGVAVTVLPRVFVQAIVMFQRRLDLSTTLNRVTVDLVKMF